MIEKFFKELLTDNETKPFYTTSEFWVFVGAEVTALGNLLPTANPIVRTAIAGGSAIAYKLARGLAKSGVKPS